MVESQVRAQPGTPLDRPSSGGYFVRATIPPGPTSEDNIPSPGVSPAISVWSDDNENITTPTLISAQPFTSNRDTFAQSSVIHASIDMSDQQLGDTSRPRQSRRRSHSRAVNQTQFHSSRTPHSPPGYAYPPSSSRTTDNRHPTAFQVPPAPYSTSMTVQYAHRPELLTQYTMSTPPGSMAIPHSASYVYSPTFHSSMDHPQRLHGNYTSMMPSPPPLYHQYPASTVDHATSSGTVYPGSRTSSAYASTSLNVQPPGSSPHILTSQQQGPTISGAYIGPRAFQPIGYPSPSHYTYNTPVYSTGYHPSFSRPYPQSTESEPQGTWVYLPHPPSLSPQQYDTNPQYTTSYSHNYVPMGHSQIDNQFPVPTSRRSKNTSTHPTPSHRYPPHISEAPISTEQNPTSSRGLYATHERSDTTSASSSSEQLPLAEESIVRQPYHPNSPARSEWVMWVGNVPSDTTQQELETYFRQSPKESSTAYHSGVLSVFLIARSSCAFVNYDAEASLLEAVARFNGVPLRTHDPRSAALVCRVRRKEDDLKAGVGGQRGIGMHTRWIKQQKGKGKEISVDHNAIISDDPYLPSSSSISDELAYAISNVSLSGSDEDGHPHGKHSSGSGSFTSTNSGFLVRYFPKRYFILKSHTQVDLDISVENGVWATQKHNEGILDQAYRTSKDVFLIFSVNKSGEFYGYARMSGPVRRGEQSVAWAPRRSAPPTGTRSGTTILASDGRQVGESPLPLYSPSSASVPSTRRDHHHVTAPPLLGQKYHLHTIESPGMKYSLDPGYHFLDGRASASRFELDKSAPLRAVRNPKASQSASLTGSQEEDQDTTPPERPADESLQIASRLDTWGDCFSVEWIIIHRLPFHRARHFRNPWNHDREVKVSRDGTELEPSVGQQLLDEWETLADLTIPLPSGKRSSRSSQNSSALLK